ncbi:DNA-protecting protein DprA [Pseudomonas yamanorum]|uniref:DNA-processing protein DprA n=1 Tax=Pseudomonas yamanorum TaxID=515393 RepID=UPI001C485422|nr:DNA-processing protein DprA [Pseudomonas yamanorum]MBV6660605.1 DNA-protecting protein DprA [Pseudomonas yamanorum]
MFLEEITDRSRKIAWMHAALVLSKKINIGSAKANDDLKRKIIDACSVERLYDEYFSMFPVDEDIGRKISDRLNRYKSQFSAITCLDEGYPEKLKAFPGTPPIIYVQGDQQLLHCRKSIAFVGTRELYQITHIEHGERVVRRLLDSGYDVIVSGLALGSDTLGHRAAIKFGGRTIAVLGTPLDLSYPKENKALQAEIGVSNLLVSEYPIGIGSFGSYFANRNRTTVALSSDGVVVARAGDKSGTQYAIRICIEQFKQLYVLENNIQETSYEWVRKYKDKLKVIREDFDASNNI